MAAESMFGQCDDHRFLCFMCGHDAKSVRNARCLALALELKHCHTHELHYEFIAVCGACVRHKWRDTLKLEDMHDERGAERLDTEKQFWYYAKDEYWNALSHRLADRQLPLHIHDLRISSFSEVQKFAEKQETARQLAWTLTAPLVVGAHLLALDSPWYSQWDTAHDTNMDDTASDVS